MPELALKCIESWHRHMPDYQYRLWNEDNFNINCNTYVKEAYDARKFAFVSDYVRLYALYTEGGIYLDTDVEVFKSFEDFLHLSGFIGFEGTKHCPVGTGVIASVPKGQWLEEQIAAYEGIHFILPDGSYDLTTNPVRISAIMRKNGFVQDGTEQSYKDMHVFPVDFFCPRQSTGEYFKTENTYCDHHYMGSWGDKKGNFILKLVGPKILTRLIKLKRRLLG